MKTLLVSLFAFCLYPLLGQSQVTDIAGKTYKTVTIGNQTWMAENLNVVLFRNGDSILVTKTQREWYDANNAGIPACINFRYSEDFGEIYGKMYNWYAVTDERGLAPEGWSIPTDADWDTLTMAIGGPEGAMKKIKSTEGWTSTNNEANDETGFGGIATGMVEPDGRFIDVGFFGYWWTRDERDGDGLKRMISFENQNFVGNSTLGKGNGLTVRCLKD
ncbi:MAG: fibrobacter succinogenes major paralogous domain-containing protein [Algoriphagus sp.]|nr:fibrobacter succinogenes major paralogous domain-containing protein [Algoriphagus sp.]